MAKRARARAAARRLPLSASNAASAAAAAALLLHMARMVLLLVLGAGGRRQRRSWAQTLLQKAVAAVAQRECVCRFSKRLCNNCRAQFVRLERGVALKRGFGTPDGPPARGPKQKRRCSSPIGAAVAHRDVTACFTASQKVGAAAGRCSASASAISGCLKFACPA